MVSLKMSDRDCAGRFHMRAKIDGLFSADSAADVLIGLTRARLLSNAIMAAANLNLADSLAQGPKSVETLAIETGADGAPWRYRVNEAPEADSRACQVFCVTFLLTASLRDSIAVHHDKLVERNAPVPNRHRPLLRHVVQRQIENLQNRFVAWKRTAVLQHLAHRIV